MVLPFQDELALSGKKALFPQTLLEGAILTESSWRPWWSFHSEYGRSLLCARCQGQQQQPIGSKLATEFNGLCSKSRSGILLQDGPSGYWCTGSIPRQETQ
jgi:hypothetical protein